MRRVPFVFLATLTLSAAAIDCGGESASGVALIPGASGLGGGSALGGSSNEAAGAGGASPTKSDSAPAASSMTNTPSSAASGGSAGTDVGDAGPMQPTSLAGCDMPADLTPTTVTMSVPDANWFSSATQARAMLELGLAPIPALVRDADFLAYYATRTTTTNVNPAALSITPLGGPGGSPVESIVQINVQAAAIAVAARPSASITFLLDTSTSMGGSSMNIAHEAMLAILGNLTTGDTVSLVTTLHGAVPQTFVLEKPTNPAATAALGSVETNGGEDIAGALVTAYAQAQKTYKSPGMNRVVFISDGGALPTSIDADLVSTNAAPGPQGDIRLVGVGTGDEPGYNPALLERAASAGRGALVYLNNTADADAQLDTRFDELLGVAATSVKLALSFPWYFTPADLSSTDYVSDPTRIVATDLGPNGVIRFRQPLRICNPQIVEETDFLTALVTWNSPGTSTMQSASVQAKIDVLLNGSSPDVLKTNAILAYTEALRSLDPKRLTNAFNLATAGAANDSALAEIASLIAMHPAFPK